MDIFIFMAALLTISGFVTKAIFHKKIEKNESEGTLMNWFLYSAASFIGSVTLCTYVLICYAAKAV